MNPTSDPDVFEELGQFRVRNYNGQIFRIKESSFEEAVALANKHAENLQKETKMRDDYINRRRMIVFNAGIDGTTLAHNDVPYSPENFKLGWRKVSQSCSYCGSLHPHTLAEFIKQGATLELADMKYGWPHKWYIGNAPDSNLYGKLATVKFYAVHLKDASADDREVIERAMKMRYQFNVERIGDVKWTPFKLENKDD